MIATRNNERCEKAMEFYYAYQDSSLKNIIPVDIAEHIEHCPVCMEEVDRLRETLSDADSRRPSVRRPALNRNLWLQFQYCNTAVPCRCVKPFLATQAMPGMAVTAPSPITVHLEYCPDCRADLEMIESWQLTEHQLARLGQFLADTPPAGQRSYPPRRIQEMVSQLARLNYDGVKAEDLKQICLVKSYRDMLYDVREKLTTFFDNRRSVAAQADAAGTQSVSGSPVTWSELFDYVLPYGIDPKESSAGVQRLGFGDFARKYPGDYRRLQELHQWLYAIAERSDSGVRTVYEIKQQIADEVKSKKSELLHIPYSVKVFAAGDSIDLAARLEQAESLHLSRAGRPVKRRTFLTGVAAAAVVVFAASVGFFSNSLTATKYDRVLQAVKKAPHIHIAKYVAGAVGDELAAEPLYEIWSSRTLDITLYEMPTGRTIWDLPGRQTWGKSAGSTEAVTQTLDAEAVVKARRQFNSMMMVVPFADNGRLPAGAQWESLDTVNSGTPAPQTQVYRLTWQETQANVGIVYHQWVGHIDPETCLPLRSEFYVRSGDEESYHLVSVYKIRTITEGAFKQECATAGYPVK